MTVRTVLGAIVFVATCVACSSNEPPKYPSTKGMTPGEARDMYNAAYERQAPYRQIAVAERERLWIVEEK